MGKRKARQIWEYDTMDDFTADGGASLYGNGGVRIGNDSYTVSNGLLMPLKSKTNNAGRCLIAPWGGSRTSTAIATTTLKQQALPIPVKFNAVRLGYVHNGGNGATVATTIAVAATDDMGLLDYEYKVTATDHTLEFKKFVEPRLAGTKFNSITAGVDPGWKIATFASAASVNIADPGAGNDSVTWTDIIPLNGVADINDPSIFPLLIRTDHGTGPFTRFVGKDNGINIGTNGKDAVNRYAPKFVSRAAAGGVANPSLWTEALSPNADAAGRPVLFIELFTDAKITSIMLVGDSRLSISTELSGTTPWQSVPLFLSNELVDKGIDAQIQDLAVAGQTLGQYTAGMDLALAANNKPDYIVYLAFSVNGAAAITGDINTAKRSLLSFIDKCLVVGATPIVLTAFPNSGGYTEGEQALLNSLAQMCEDLLIPHINPLKLFGTTTGIYKQGYGNTGIGGNLGVHMTQLGYQELAKEISNFINY